MTFLDYEFTRPDGGNKSQGWALLSVCWALVTAASVTTVLRVFVRTQLTHNMGADDWVMVLCLFTTWLGAGMITTEIIQGGLGRHGYYLQPDQKRHFLAVGWGDWIQTFVTLALMKIAICLFLLRIVDARKIRLVLWGFIGFIVLFTLTFIALFLAICRPIRAYWTVMPEAHCLTDLQIQYITLAQGVLSAITDLILSAFPYFFLRNLHVSRRTKVALVVLMGLGAMYAHVFLH
ncbi:uncharacterized protein KY384_003450 [Bacidia gigantensis]|uniref:uncharacterized protein n=1 Tax=Bacidia gigantensis TaxID=2732470 RepID=UPI001D0405DE|nr:uncharacterized protein KY384_003450 [Bacidia gigantensis]KAG8531814.1 hypothetical protein KY384_003450 [Bacidia gigantensis]